MLPIRYKILAIVILSSMLVNPLMASAFEDQKKAKMIQDLEVIRHHFEIGYAPAEWKKEYAGWDLDEAFSEAKQRVLKTPSMTTQEFQHIVCDFFKTMRDYHVDVVFFSTEKAFLPFTVKGAEGRYFIDWVDGRYLHSRCPMQPGDELLEFDNRPIGDVVRELHRISGKSSSPETDQALALMSLTQRTAAAGDVVPKGRVFVKTQSTADGRVFRYSLRWSYHAEHISSPLDMPPALTRSKMVYPFKPQKGHISDAEMVNPLHKVYASTCADRPGELGANKSFIPPLGQILWTFQNDHEKAASIRWNAYIYLLPSGIPIGYIRIPHYEGNQKLAEKFGHILNVMEEHTEALVIDQVHNHGGLANFAYELASMLATKPLQTPHHRIKITQKEVYQAYKKIKKITSAPEDADSSDAGNSDEDESAMERLYAQLMGLKSYYEFIINEWNQGHTLTSPTPIIGIDFINPHPKYHYTKPILVLINEMDFSAGDFIPAILQDNQRARLFGSRTAGAGGVVAAFEFPNVHGIYRCSYTCTIAERSNSNKIENLGVTPDIEYRITAQDIQGGYQNYIDAVNIAVERLLHYKE